MSTMETRLEDFSDMMFKVWSVFFWHYDSQGRLISSTCPEEQLFSILFITGGSKQRCLDICSTSKKVALIADSTGLIWLAVPYFADEIFSNLLVIGPIFTSEVSEGNLYFAVRDSAIPAEWRIEMLTHLKELPIIQHTAFMQFGIMLQYIINGEVIGLSDVQIARADKWKASLAIDSKSPKNEVVGSYNYECKLMNAIETGNIDFKRPSNPPKVGKLSTGDPIRQARNEMLVFITIISRAALRGGLPEETAYGLADQYTQKNESEKDISQIYSNGAECYKDYLYRMYKLKLSQGRSREIQSAIAYIEAHINEKIDYEDMAVKCGYSRKYLSVKFKSEMGVSMVDYITEQKVEQAKVMLRNSQGSIIDISNELKFVSNSYFTSTFRKLMGITPKEYRNGLEGKRKGEEKL